ncbi:MAG: hypothetical protein PHF70_07375, partial [Opitutales bacterium]|nr:hypothetical protein [Opitutales bacterium]
APHITSNGINGFEATGQAWRSVITGSVMHSWERTVHVPARQCSSPISLYCAALLYCCSLDITQIIIVPASTESLFNNPKQCLHLVS